MYNRYVPQPDGTFLRSQIQDTFADRKESNSESNAAIEITETRKPEQSPIVKQPINNKPVQRPTSGTEHRIRSNKQRTDTNTSTVGGFLKGLLPQNFDTEDLMVVLLLLLMSGGNNQDQNAALLTLGIYLFM